MAVSRTFTQFQARMEIRATEVGVNLTKAMKKVAKAVDQTVVLATPVDTGRARSNWLGSLNSPRNDEIEPYAEGKGLGLGESANAAGAIAQASSVIDKFKLDNTIFIQNNVDYIQDLNAGPPQGSEQAPKNFVQRAIVVAAEAIKGIRIFRVK